MQGDSQQLRLFYLNQAGLELQQGTLKYIHFLRQLKKSQYVLELQCVEYNHQMHLNI